MKSLGFLLLVALVVGLTLFKAGCVSNNMIGGARYKATRSVAVPGSTVAAVTVEAHNGSVDLRKADGASQTTVVAHLRAQTQERLDAATVVADRKPDGALFVTVRWPDGGARNNEGCSFEITLPSAPASVTATSTNGAITLAALAGPARLDTSNGAISVTDHAGPVLAETSNGAVTLRNIAGDAEARTSNGRIEITHVDGRATARTSNGAVTLALSDKSPGPVDVRTSNGAVDLTLSRAFAGNLSLSTSNGSLRYQTTPAVKQVSADKHHARLAIGDSPTPSTATTSNGSIALHFAD